MFFYCAWWLPAGASMALDDVPSTAELKQSLEVILKVEPDSQKDAEARRAWQVVQRATLQQVPHVLVALDNATPLAANWLNTALDAIAARSSPGEKDACVGPLTQTALDTSHGLLTRRIALDLVGRFAPDKIAEIQTQLRNDPEATLRRPAIAAELTRLTTLSRDAEGDRSPANRRQLAPWRQLFDEARDEDQVNKIATNLRQLGDEPDLARKFGYVTSWQVIGPFDNPKGQGFDTAYPPESLQLKTWRRMRDDLSSHTLDGKSGQATWRPAKAKSANGDVDLNQSIAKLRDVVGYGVTTISAEDATDVEIRLRVQNAFKIWLNGQLLLSQPVGHTGNSFDMYRAKAHLNAGENIVVIKSCQVDIKGVAFFDTWHFSVRVCDPTGGAVDSVSTASEEKGAAK